jgi:hypothetical protein
MLRVERESLIFKRRPTFINNLTLQRDSINIIRVKERENISPPINVTIVIRWDSLLRIVLPEWKNTRGEIKKRHHAHATEDDEPPKKLAKEEIEEYVLFSALLGYMTVGEETWLIDSGASKHMTGEKNTLSRLIEKDSPESFTGR